MIFPVRHDAPYFGSKFWFSVLPVLRTTYLTRLGIYSYLGSPTKFCDVINPISVNFGRCLLDGYTTRYDAPNGFYVRRLLYALGIGHLLFEVEDGTHTSAPQHVHPFRFRRANASSQGPGEHDSIRSYASSGS